ncbi:MAG TPA: SHOCT domain-containing protein [Solirubrobacterales bacterium]
MAATDPPETRYRITVRILVVLASVLAFLAIFTSWVDRQALDTDEWVDTSGRVLEDREISDALAVYAVDQLYANVEVAAVLKKRLPEDLQPISAPVAAGIRQFATRAAQQALRSERVLAVWKDTNRIAHRQLLAILKGDNEVVSTETGRVALDLRPLVLQLADRIGLKKQANDRLPADVGELEVADAKQLDTARTIVRIIEGLAWLFSIGTLVLFALAAYLAKGRRWIAVLGYGLGLIAAGLAAIAVRAATEELMVDTLARTEEARIPAEHAWEIATSLLHSIASSVIIFGVLFVVASFLASPANAAVSIRQGLAPTLRERPAVVWSVFAAVALIGLIVWPPDATRQAVLALLLIALAAVGVEALSRKTRHEFPSAKRGDWLLGMRQRARQASAEAGRRIGSALRELADDDRHPDDAKFDRLERLGELKEKGILTAAEFRDEKKKILEDRPIGNGGRDPGAEPKPKATSKAKPKARARG